MYVQIYNRSSLRFPLPGVGDIAAHAAVQRFRGTYADFFSFRDGTNGAEELARVKAAGIIDYQFVLDDADYGRGLAVKTLRASFAIGSFAVDDTTADIVDDDAFPAGAILLEAHLDVHQICTGGGVTALEAGTGTDVTCPLFDVTQNIYAGATTRPLLDAPVGQKIGGHKLKMSLIATDGDLSELTQGNVELVVSYWIVPVL